MCLSLPFPANPFLPSFLPFPLCARLNDALRLDGVERLDEREILDDAEKLDEVDRLDDVEKLELDMHCGRVSDRQRISTSTHLPKQAMHRKQIYKRSFGQGKVQERIGWNGMEWNGILDQSCFVSFKMESGC